MNCLLRWMFCASVMCCLVSVSAQERSDALCSAGKRYLSQSNNQKPTIASPEEDKYDVKHVFINVALSSTSVAIQGNVTTTALVVAPLLQTYVFELDTQLAIDSILINGQLTSFSNNGYVRTAIIPIAVPNGSLFSAQVYYHGNPVAGNGYFKAGLNNAVDGEWGYRSTYTLSEPYMAYQWWPCKQSLKDKIDSADIWIGVSNHENAKAGSNGILDKVTQVATFSIYQWKTKYPIAYYLLSAAVGRYRDYSYKVKLPGVTDSLLVQNYIYDSPEVLNKYKNGIDSTALMLQYFSELFGTYPFYKEKYGHCLVPLPGGMEHQTMTTLGDFGTDLVSHELAHQWWGDHVTCATWKDIWLNEGFATYGAYLFTERFRPQAAGKHLQDIHNVVLRDTIKSGSVYVDDTNTYRVFDGRLSYNKAAAVIHTLRFVAGNDSLFFALLKKYQQDFAFKTATTKDFQLLAEQVLGKNLSVFFEQWIYKQGYPVYESEWTQLFNTVYIKLKQTNALQGSATFFETPLEIKLLSPEGDTTVTVYHDLNTQLFKLKCSRKITEIVIDPNNWLLNEWKSNVWKPEIAINEVISTDIVVYPNPSNEDWFVTGLEKACILILTDEAGHVLWRGSNENVYGMRIPGSKYARGAYNLVVRKGNIQIQSFKLIKL